MKQNLHIVVLILLFVAVYATACKKSTDQPKPVQNVTNQIDTALAVPYPATPTLECNFGPYYGDSIVYPQPSNSGDYYVYPQNNQGLQGSYFSWPAGLDINVNTGVIDLTQSATGQRYSVAFIKAGTTDTCLSPLIVGGVAYMDSVYDLSQSDTTSQPYFNANPYTPSPCEINPGPGPGPGPGCQFDYNDFAKRQKIDVDKKTGFINLKSTMQKNPFGPHPINGATINTSIYYKLDDYSNNAVQNIQVQLIYYNHKSDIPSAILLTVRNNLVNTLNNVLLSKGPSARPPIIIIVRDSQ